MIIIFIFYNDIHYLYICCMKYMANVAEPLFSNPFEPFLKPNIKPL